MLEVSYKSEDCCVVENSDDPDVYIVISTDHIDLELGGENGNWTKITAPELRWLANLIDEMNKEK